MARRSEAESRSSSSAPVSLDDLLKHIEDLVDGSRQQPLEGSDELLSSLRRWWCRHYNRPYKDPMLLDYSLEELWFEYLDVTYDERQAKKEAEQKAGLTAPSQDDYDWAAKMEEEDEDLPHMENEASSSVPAEAEGDSGSLHPDTIEDGAEFSADFT